MPCTVYADGVFDLFHPGHIAFLKKARALGGAGAELLVGVVADEDTGHKRRPVMSFAERLTMVQHCTEVARVVDRAPLYITGEFIDENGIDLVVHADDDRQEHFYRAALERGIMRYVPYTKGVSTTGLIERVRARGGTLDRADGLPRADL